MEKRIATAAAVEPGRVYENAGGGWYQIKSATDEKTAYVVNVRTGWTCKASGVVLYESGRIEWDYSTGGRFDERHAPRTRRACLVEAYRRTWEGTPADTVGALVDMIGRPDALRAIAEAVRGLAAVQDVRICFRNVQWSETVPDAMTADELQARDVWTITGSIHPAHMDQIATAARMGGDWK